MPIVLPRKHVTRVLEILNHSDATRPVLALRLRDAHGLFTMDAPSGVVPARLSSFVNLSFSPLEPGNFYKRVYLLLRSKRRR